MDWRTAYLGQAKSDFSVFYFCHHNLLIPYRYATSCTICKWRQKKLAKGYRTAPNGTRFPNTHNAFVRFLQVAQGQPELRHQLGFKDTATYTNFLRSLLPIAQAIENLSPEGGDHPNPEYPWEAGNNISVPHLYSFPELQLNSPQMKKMIDFIKRCLENA